MLFDEIEKAHPDIQNILLQILEDGCLTDSMGRKADFTNTIILLTSNLGARCLAGQGAPLGFAAGQEAAFEKQSAAAIAEAKGFFRPELVGRLDEMIVFRPLGSDSLCRIADRLLGQLEQRAARSGYTLTHTPGVCRALAAKAASPYGGPGAAPPGGPGGGAGPGRPDCRRHRPSRRPLHRRLRRRRLGHPHR